MYLILVEKPLLWTYDTFLTVQFFCAFDRRNLHLSCIKDGCTIISYYTEGNPHGFLYSTYVLVGAVLANDVFL